MPMIDVYAPTGLFAVENVASVGTELANAVLRAEGVTKPGPFHLQNTASFIHIMDSSTITTAAADNAICVRVQIITPPKALNREGQIRLVREITDLIAEHSEKSLGTPRTWVVLSEASEGGWGLGGTAYGKEEFLELAARGRR